MTNPTPHGQVPASSAVLKAIREANMQLVRTGDDAYMLLPYLQAHVQNPAEIEHVAGDVSKNGAEVNVSAQQAAPSAAAQIDSALNDYAQAFVARVNGWTKQNGDDLPVARAVLFQAITDYARKLAMAAPQPTPTAQADSQPVLDEATAMNRTRDLAESGRWPSDWVESYRRGYSDRAANAPADSQPAWASQAVIEYRYTGGTRWCPLGPAERMKPNFDGVYRLQGGVFPVESTADSGAAPAVPSKSLPYEPTSAMLIAARERDPALPIETVRAIYWSMWRTAPTQPAQAADSVLEVIWRDAAQQAAPIEPTANDIHGALTAAAIYLANAQRQYEKEMHRQAIASLQKAQRAIAQAAGFAKATPPAQAADSVLEDAAFEAVRKKLCALPRYSFVLDDDGLIRRVQDRTGNWIEFDAAHELFDPVAVDAARKQGGAT